MTPTNLAPKFVQIAVDGSKLYALDTNGRVWLKHATDTWRLVGVESRDRP